VGVALQFADSKKEITRLVQPARSSNSKKRVAGTPSGGPASPLIWAPMRRGARLSPARTEQGLG
jgi:hypothetical protein